MENYGCAPAINETSVTVTFPNDAGIEESDLTGKEITLKAGETTLTATYKADSFVDNKATFSLSGDSKLVDATTYTVTGNILKGSTDFVAEVVDAYAKTFEASTTAIAADVTSKVFFSAKDQYGKDIVLEAATTAKNLKVSATVNGVPLTADEAKFAADYKSVEIGKALKENDVLKVTVSNTANEVDYKESFNYTVGEKETAVETSFGDLTAKYVDKSGKATETLSATDTATLTVPVLNQFGNPMTLDANPVRWVVTKGKDLITTPGADKAVTDAKGEFKFTANNPGEVVIDAYLANGQTVQFTKVIGAENLESIKVVTTDSEALSKTKYNNEEIVVAVLNADPTSALLNKEDIKLDVKAGKDLTTADITTSVETVTVGKGEDAKEVIVVKAKTTKAGSYSITPYIGDAVDAEGVVKGTDITFATTLNPTVASFEVAPVKENELSVGGKVTKALTFKNKYDEVIKVLGDKITLASSDVSVATVTPTAAAVDKDGNAVLEITGVKEGTATVTVVSGAVSKQVTFDVVGVAKLDTVSLGQAITKGVFAGTDTPVTQVVTMKDQFGNDFIPADDKLADTVIASDVDGLATDLQYYKVNEKTGDKVLQGTNQDSDTVGVVLVVNANDVTLAEANAAETAKVTATIGDKEVSSVNVTVQPKAVLDKVTTTVKNTNITAGGKSTVRVVPTNQYGEVVDLTGGSVALDASPFTIVQVNQANFTAVTDNGKADGDLIGYDVVVQANDPIATGKATAKLVIKENGASAEEAKNSSVDFNVVTAGEVIDTVEIEQKEGVQDGKEGVQLEAVIKDSANQVVEVADTDLTWSIKGVKDSKGNVLEGTWDATEGTYTIAKGTEDAAPANEVVLKIKNGKITTTEGNKLPEGLTIDVAVKVESINFITAETTVTISEDAAKYEEGFKVDKVYDGATVEEAKEVKLEGTSVEITDVDSKAVTFTFTGVDQYGEEFPIVDGTTATSSTPGLVVSYAGEDTSAGTLTVTATEAKDGKLFIKYGDERLTLDLKLSDKVKAAIELATAKTTAKSSLDTYVTADEYTTNSSELSAAIAAGKLAIQAADTTTAVTAALEAAKLAIDEIDSDADLYSITAKDELSVGDTIVIKAKGADDLRVMVWAEALNNVAAAQAAYGTKIESARFSDMATGFADVDPTVFKSDGDTFTITITQAFLDYVATKADSSVSNLTWIFTPEADGEFLEGYHTWDGEKVEDTFKVYSIATAEVAE